LTTLFPEAGSAMRLFLGVEGCTLMMSRFDHVLFHFSQIPFLAVMTTFKYRAYQAARRASLQKPQTVVPGSRAQMNNLYRSSSWQRLF